MDFFSELVEWSREKDSYSIDDFFLLKSVTDQQVLAMTGGRNSCFLPLVNLCVIV
jgi:hypothetical protein